MNAQTATALSGGKARMRSGAAARLAGIPATTLRIWEYRYGIVVPPKSTAGQRTYSMKDVERLRNIKLLTSVGHAISTLAHLDDAALVALSAKTPHSSRCSNKVLVVGRTVALKLEGRLTSEQLLVFDDLSHAEREVAVIGQVSVLVIQVRTLNVALVARIIDLRDKLLVPNVIVLYSFGAESVSDPLYAAGITSRREPLTGKELYRLIAGTFEFYERVNNDPQPSVRLYSDIDLARLSDVSSSVSCECPRHLAEIVTLLVAFEEYSTECGAQLKKDAALHLHLREVTARARTILERALERVVIEEDLSEVLSR